MALLDLWKASHQQLEGKHVQQMLGLAGSGKLLDGNSASAEFREFLAYIPTNLLARYAEESLSGRFDGSGLALQDVINQVGRRLGFEVTHGRCRGAQAHIGYDGLWK